MAKPTKPTAATTTSKKTAKPKTSKKAAKTSKRATPSRPEAWIGGIASMPSYVHEGDAPYRPDVVTWVSAQDLIVGFTLMRPGEGMAPAVESFIEATQSPMAGPPRVPSSVCVASPDLADALRARLGDQVRVELAPTPELDAVLDHLRDFLQTVRMESDEPATYLGPGITEDAMAAFFRAAAALYRAKPWKHVPTDSDLLAFSAPSLGVHDVAVSVIGQAGESYGVIVFPDVEAFDAFLTEAELAAVTGEMPKSLAESFSINFERGADLEPELRKEISQHGWEVAGPQAYPWLAHMDADIVARGPTAQELTVAEALALGLTRLFGEKGLKQAWKGEASLERTYRVETHEGPVEVEFKVPHPEWD